MRDVVPRSGTVDPAILPARVIPQREPRHTRTGRRGPWDAKLRAGWGPTKRRYTLDEEAFILAHLTCWSRAAIARHLGRTPRQIKDWCWRTGQHPRNQHLLTSGEAARLAGVSQQWLTELARADRIKARREPGGRWWLFDPEEVRALRPALHPVRYPR